MGYGALIGGVISALASSGGAPSGSSGNGFATAQYAPWVAPQYVNAVNAYGTQAGNYQSSDPALTNQAFQQQFNNPYSGQYQTAAGQAGAMQGQAAPQAMQYAQGQYAGGQQALNAGQQVYNTALDPQSALYNQTVGNLMNQTNAQQALRGLGNSPQGAQEAGTTLGNFNIDWQNQQLARQQQGASALNSGLAAYSTAGGQAANLMNTAAGQQQQSGMLPYNASQGISQNQFGALSNAQGSMASNLAPMSANINQMGSFLGLGQSAQAAQNAFAQQNQANQQNAIAGGMQMGQALAPAAQNAWSWLTTPSSSTPYQQNGTGPGWAAQTPGA